MEQHDAQQLMDARRLLAEPDQPAPPAPSPATLTALLEARANQQPTQLAIAWLRDDLTTTGSLTYGDLRAQVRRLASRLGDVAERGERVLLAYGPGMDAVRAFWACLYAGLIPVPAPSPDAARLKRALPRLRAIAADAGTSAVLTTSALRDAASALRLADEPALARWIATDIDPEAHGVKRDPAPAKPADIAYLQYTSGSTSTPRGVQVTHDNVLDNCAALSAGSGVDAGSRALFWLPYFHDYGLVHGLLWPVYAGIPVYLMSPLTFLRRPLRWLEAIGRFGITHSGAPNFAYDACIQAAERSPQWHTDLASLRMSGCGAEPINPSVVRRFVRTFERHGFRPEAFTPGYGLAEATLIVSMKPFGVAPILLDFDAEALGQGLVEPTPPDAPGARTLVGCGAAPRDMKIAIVDGESRTRVEPERIGEIWVAGASVTAGYRGNPARSPFGETLHDSPDSRWLRTGDLGFMHRNELFIVGRLKDLLIFHGGNHYPQDIEWTAERADARLRKGFCAAFAIEGAHGEELAVVQEVERGTGDADLPALATAIRKAVADEHELPVHSVALIRAGSIPRTSSGKIRRAACKAAFLASRLDLSLLDTREAQASDPAAAAFPEKSVLDALPTTEDRRLVLRRMLIEHVARLTGREADALSPAASPIECGMDSLSTFRLLNDIETALGVSIPPAAILGSSSLDTVAGHILEQIETATPALTAQTPAAERGATDTRRLPLSAPQEGVWFVEKLIGPSALYHLTQAVRLSGPLDPAALEKSLQSLVNRHGALRTAFHESDGVARQVVLQSSSLELGFVDLDRTATPERDTALERMLTEDARRPFDLAHAPLLRARLYRTGEDQHVLLLVLHHLVGDGWSMALLARELHTLYAAGGDATSLPPVPATYDDHVHWQRNRFDDARLQADLAYWRAKLEGLQPIELPTDRPRPARRSFRGGIERFAVPSGLTAALKRLAQEENTTLFMVLLAAFHTLLMRYTGQDDLAVASPTAGRLRNEMREVFGLFTNTLLLRADLSGNPSFRQLLQQVRTTALEAYQHQELPSERLVAELGLPRDPTRNAAHPVAFALQNIPDAHLRLDALEASPVPLHTGMATSDLWLSITGSSDALAGEVEYSTDLFDADTAQALARHFRTLLGGIVSAPGSSLASLPLLDPQERHQVLVDWNATGQPCGPFTGTHESFAEMARRAPDAAAVLFGDHTLTYAELDRRANQLAHHLRGLGVGPEVTVGLCMERSPELVIGLLGILKAGGTFLPLDPDYPKQRLEFMLSDAAVTVVLTQEALREQLPAAEATMLLCLDSQWQQVAHHPTDAPEAPCRPDQAAYVIYTSGSTGRPKGVVVPHRALTNNILWLIDTLQLTSADRVLQKTSISFDASIWEFLAPLNTGAPVVLANPGEHRDGERLLQTVRDRGITILLVVPSALRALLNEPLLAECTRLRYLRCGGEAMDRDLARETLARLPDVTLGNFYGPTEAGNDATWQVVGEIPPGPGSIPIGRPIANARCHVLDQHLQPVPPGAIGELYIGGAGLARGYLNHPELTAERFIPDPFQPGERLYRTGDRARYLPGGILEYSGRVDQQVKLRGFRIEPAEIETALRECPGIGDCAVILLEDAGQQQLVGYVTGRDIDIDAVKTRLHALLPDYMVPAAIVPLERLPLLPSGKLDRRALPAPAADARIALRPPRGPVEQALWDIWSEVLRQPRIGVDQDFFELGGHSLLATQVASRIRQTLQVELPLRILFEEPTIARLARHLERLQQTDEVMAPDQPIETLSRQQPLPVSFSQRRMWFVQQFEPRGTAYNMPLALRLKGPLNMAALEAAVQAIVRRHEAFRTTFRVANGEPVQVIGSHQPARIRHIDLRTLPDDRREAQARRLFRDESLQPFDLEHGPLFRFVVVQIADADHAMLWLVHHAVGDQWSFSILVRDLASYYGACLRGEQPAEQPLAIQYADFAAWQRHRHSGAALDNQLAYWKDRLRELPVLALPTDHPRPPQQTFRGSNLQATIAPALLAVLKKVSAREGVTPFMTLLACFKLLLARYSGQEDFAVGVPIANRTHVAAEDLVGTLVNTLVLRTSLGGDPTFKTLLTRIRETALGAYAHQDLPFERLVDELDVKREGGRSPLVQVLFNVPNAPMYDMDLSGLEYELFDFDSGAAQFDLSMSVETEIFGRVYLSYAIDMFEPATAQRLLEHYLRLLEQVLADPDRPLSAYEILNDAERQTLLTDWNRTQTPYPAERRADELIATQAAASPEAVAMSMDGQHLTYGDLEARANRLARYLQQRGVRRNSAVGICLERSTDLVVALLATMKSGGTYIPLDPAFPRDRLQFMARDADLKALVTHSELLQTLPEMSGRAVCLDDAAAAVAMLPDGPLEPGSGPDDLAYVLYTSGSTGKPKGVEISHRALTNFLCSMRTTPGCSGADRLLAVTTLSFDIAGLEIYLPLISGGKVELASRQEAADGRLLKERLREYRPTLMQATPATWRMLIAAGWHGNRRLRILCGGEALPADLAVQLLERCGELWNMYGPTETTIWSTMTRIRDAQTPISIGRPIANTQVYVLDRTLQPVPVGVAGELYIGGHGLARGYRNRTTLTAERFIAHPFAEHPGERLYRTGDLVRWSADGRLHHMGRLDFQVKIRGFRIELGEIEARLARHPAIAQAVATARPDRDGQNQLVAYIRAREGHAQPEAVELRTFVRTTLPDYMTPAHFVFLQAFPLTANNKIDIKALPEPVVASSARAAPAQPQGRLEVQLTALWRQVLEDETLGVHENFFDAGGHSLKAVQLVSYIEQVCGQTLPLATLFEAPTVAQMARLLQKNWKPSWDSLVAIQPAGDETPIFAVPGVGGNVLMFARLSKLMGTQRPFYGLQARGLDSAQKPFTSVRRMAAHYTQEIRSIRPRGPYIIAGACTGGVIAFEMARQLVAAGEKVTLMLMESWHPISARGPLFSGMLLWPMWALWQRITRRSGRDRVARATWHAVANYRPPPIAARMLHVIAAERPLHPRTADTRRMWDALTTEGCETHYMPALDSGQLFTPRHAGELADIVRDYIAREQG